MQEETYECFSSEKTVDYEEQVDSTRIFESNALIKEKETHPVESTSNVASVLSNFQKKIQHYETQEQKSQGIFDMTKQLSRFRALEQLVYESKRAVNISLAPIADEIENVSADVFVNRLRKLQEETNELISYIETFVTRLSEENLLMPSHSSPEKVDEAIYADLCEFFGGDPQTLLTELTGLRQLLMNVEASSLIQSLKNLSPEPTVISKKNFQGQNAALTHIISDQCNVLDQILKQSSSGSPVEYELCSLPSSPYENLTSKLLAFEKRLAKVETDLGMHKLTQVSFPDVATAIEEIGSRLISLHPSYLDTLEKRLQKIGAQIDEFIRNKQRCLESSTIKGGINEQAILDLYEFSESTKHLTAALPFVTRRLKILKLFHQDCAAVASRLTTLEKQQEELEQLFLVSQKNFECFKDSMKTNIQLFRKIVVLLDKSTSEQH